MATKTITIAEDAYERLKTLKREGESFSEVIRRVVPRTDPGELVGLLTPEQGEQLTRAIGEARAELDEDVARTAEKLRGTDR